MTAGPNTRSQGRLTTFLFKYKSHLTRLKLNLTGFFIIIGSSYLFVKMTNYQVRYGNNVKKHRKKCRNTHTRTYGICCVCMINKSEQVHHSSYRQSGDRYGINIFPVCKHCHKNVCHSPKNWIIHPTNPEWKNHNTPEFTARLKRNYQRLRKLKLKKKPS